MSIRHFLTLHTVNKTLFDATDACRRRPECDLLLLLGDLAELRLERRDALLELRDLRRGLAMTRRCALYIMVRHLMVHYIVSIRHFLTLCSVNKTLFDTF